MTEVIKVSEYIREVNEDITSPPTSNFDSKMTFYKQSINNLEEGLDRDRDGLTRTKKAVKTFCSSGQIFVSTEVAMSDALVNLNNAGWRPEEKALAEACNKFAIVIKEHSQLLDTLINKQENNLITPLNTVLKGELKGVKGDLKRPFEKAAKDYETKHAKYEKEVKQQAKEKGFYNRELGPADVAEEMSKERKFFQLQMCEYLIKVNKIKTKKGVEFLQKLVEYYHAYCKYFEEGMKTWQHFGSYVTELSEKLRDVRHKQEVERRDLINTCSLIKNSLSAEAKSELTQSLKPNYPIHPPSGNKDHGTSKRGYLCKKSDGKVRKIWQRRLCEVRESMLYIYHSDQSKQPVTVPLLLCQVRAMQDDTKCFDLVSSDRTYHLMADDDRSANLWVSILLNSKEGALQKALSDDVPGPTPADSAYRELQQRIIAYVRGLPGNNRCCDCNGTNDVTWLSTNFGILVCIECSGIHRDLGVHVSRIQSLTLDKVGTAQLLLARHMTNAAFNGIAEGAVPRKPESSSTMDERREFIQAKYVKKEYLSAPQSTDEELVELLRDAVDRRDLYALLAVYFQSIDFGVCMTNLGETALHIAIYQENGSSLPLVDFLVQNSRSPDRQTKEGNTPLHYCVIYDKPECMRLLLRVGANGSIENNNGKTPLDIARERHCRTMEDMLKHALLQKKTMFENVEYEWNLSDDNFTDMSDDDDGGGRNGMATPEKRTRPASLIESPQCQRAIGGSSGIYAEPRVASWRPDRQPPPPPISSKPNSSLSDTRAMDTTTDTSSSSPQDSNVTAFINGGPSTESLPSIHSDTSEPRPPPRTLSGSLAKRRCRALYDCDADLEDELSFKEGEVILILQEETDDGDWMEGMIEGQPHRRGKVPCNFVHMLTE